jgi:phosphoribosylformimino-5-aminoimidazole carboxamide ribonucleotide (ProFAR) isomerase
VQVGTKWCIYSGDVNQDGTIDGTDAQLIDNDAGLFVSGYVNTDVNGDGTVDGSDAVIAGNNSDNFISKIVP